MEPEMRPGVVPRLATLGGGLTGPLLELMLQRMLRTVLLQFLMQAILRSLTGQVLVRFLGTRQARAQDTRT